MISFIDLSEDEQKEFLDSIDMVISDCDGVLWHENTIPGCGDVIDKLRKSGKRVVLLSNNSYEPIHILKKKIINANIENFPVDDLMVPSTTIIEYLKSIKFNKKLYTLCSIPMIEDLRNAGFDCDNGANLTTVDPSQQTELDPDVGAVILDSDITYSYMKISKAVHYLKKQEMLFLAGAVDDWLPMSQNLIVLGAGYFVKLIAAASQRQPLMFGKPGQELGDFLVKNFKITTPERVLFIGDSLQTDIVFAYKRGFRSLLVLTGLTSLEQAKAGETIKVISKEGETIVKTIKPEFYIDTLANIMPVL